MKTLRIRTVMLLEGSNMLGYDDIGSSSAQESSSDEESNDSSDNFSALTE